MQSAVTGRALPILGGALCVDFVNTVDPRFGPNQEEFLPDFRALVEWSRYVGITTAKEADGYLATASSGAAAEIHQRGHALREALFDLFRPHREDRDLRPSLVVLSNEFQLAANELELGWAPEELQLIPTADDQPANLLWAITRSALDLFASPNLRLVRECEGADCGWLFLDTSKAHRRRWCSMAICGNRAKARRHRERARRRA